MDDLNNFDDPLSVMVRNYPAEYMPVVSIIVLSNLKSP
jgi:hypothetical protein